MLKQHYRIKAVFFDFDGTLTQPGAIDFKVVKASLGCPADQPVLEFIESMEGSQDRQHAMAKLDRFEVQGAARSLPGCGVDRLVGWLKRQMLPIVVITRNSRAAVMRSLENFKHVGADDFDIIITRDDALAPKPSGDGILWAAAKLGIPSREVLMVGDYIFDLQSGWAAGALTALIDHSAGRSFDSTGCDFRVRNLDQLRPIVLAGLSDGPGRQA